MIWKLLHAFFIFYILSQLFETRFSSCLWLYCYGSYNSNNRKLSMAFYILKKKVFSYHYVIGRLCITLDVFLCNFYTWGHNCCHFPSGSTTGCRIQLLEPPLLPDKSSCSSISHFPTHFCNLLKLTIHIKLVFRRLVYGNGIE